MVLPRHCLGQAFSSRFFALAKRASTDASILNTVISKE
jgi:hypothetical protein